VRDSGGGARFTRSREFPPVGGGKNEREEKGMPVTAVAHNAPTTKTGRKAIPTALVRDLLSVGLLTECRDSARTRLERLLGPETAASVVRQTLTSSH
jgi:hypothetical protein